MRRTSKHQISLSCREQIDIFGRPRTPHRITNCKSRRVGAAHLHQQVARTSRDNILQHITEVRYTRDYGAHEIDIRTRLGRRQVDRLRPHRSERVLACRHSFFGSCRDKNCSIICFSSIRSCNTSPKIISANKACNKCRRWSLLNSFRVAKLFNMAVEHDRNAIRH